MTLNLQDKSLLGISAADSLLEDFEKRVIDVADHNISSVFEEACCNSTAEIACCSSGDGYMGGMRLLARHRGGSSKGAAKMKLEIEGRPK